MGSFFGGPHTSVFGPNFDLSSDFRIIFSKCGRGEHPFGFPKLDGPRTPVLARFSDRYTPYAKFLRLLAIFIWPQIFPKTKPPQGRSGILIWPIYLYKADRLIIILSHYNYIIFFYKNQIPDRFSLSRSVGIVFFNIIPKKLSFVKGRTCI